MGGVTLTGGVVDRSITQAVWAKSGVDAFGRVDSWLPLWQHLDDSAEVAARLWDEWFPSQVRVRVSAGLGRPDSEARRLVMFLAGVHDLGKATPAFAVQVPEFADQLTLVGLTVPHLLPDERRRLPHSLAGEVLLERWLCDRHGWSRETAAQLGVVVGGHHGVPPGKSAVLRATDHPELFGTGSWPEVQVALIERAARRTGVDRHLPAWRNLRLPQSVQVTLTALVIVADWIASSSELFPLSPLGAQPSESAEQRATRAWQDLELPRPWRPADTGLPPDDLVRTRFGWGDGVVARPVQQAALAEARAMDVPGLLVIEAPMGEGKTEAALLAAEVLAARSGAGGCFVALPTQATTDAMFERVLDWLGRVPDAVVADDARTAVVRRAASVTLAHGKASLNSTFRELRMASAAHQVGLDEGDQPSRTQSVDDSMGGLDGVVHRWMTGRKKGPLADFVVGTIDQLLFTSLRARHLALRHLGMARKVVILDEVHSFDAYMNTYLQTALEWLGAHGVTVIMLSATLPSSVRAELVGAYQRGMSSTEPVADRPVRVDWAARAAATGTTPAATAGVDAPTNQSDDAVGDYPVLTSLRGGEVTRRTAPPSGRSTHVRLETAPDDLDTLSSLLQDALAEGGCALVVRNTVARAQQTAQALSQVFESEVRLVHSRFIGHHRLANDAWLRESFGAPNGVEGRPPRAIVVGTQVVEQSLDVDFDLLVTDLAPTDLLLQRIGRLHRHERGPGESSRPARVRDARCVVVGVSDWSTTPPELDRGGRTVYGEHALLRAAALVMERTEADGVLHLPGDIAPWVQRAYAPSPVGPGSWQEAMASAALEADRLIAAKRERARVFLLASPRAAGVPVLGWVDGSIGEADDTAAGQAQVRDVDQSLEVLVLERDDDGQLRLLDGIPDVAHRLVDPERAPTPELARAIAGSAVRIGGWAVRGSGADRLISGLEKNYFPAWQRDPLLSGQLVLVLDPAGVSSVGDWVFRYTTVHGLEMSHVT